MTRYGLAGAAMLLALLGMGSKALAADPNGEFVLRGIGGQSCEEGLALVKADPRNAADLASWVTGYVTALNRVTPGTYDLLPLNDVTSVVQIVGGMCASNPKSSMEAVLIEVIQRLSKARVTTKSPLIEAAAGNRKIMIRSSMLAAMQSQLIAQKLYKGAADGQFNEKTADALKKYQKRQKLDVTGLPDAQTVIRMLIEPDQGPAAEEEKPKKEKKKP